MASPCCRLAIKVVPNASRDSIGEWQGALLKVKLRAPALEGRANEALRQFLSAALGIPPRRITLVQGEKSRQKLVGIEGLSLEETKARLRTD